MEKRIGVREDATAARGLAIVPPGSPRSEIARLRTLEGEYPNGCSWEVVIDFPNGVRVLMDSYNSCYGGYGACRTHDEAFLRLLKERWERRLAAFPDA
jgi:hypothetical protein